MAITRPSTARLMEIGKTLGMTLSEAEAAEYLACMDANLAAYDVVDAAADDVPVTAYPRTPGYRPGPDENPYNAWYVKCEIPGADSGRLAGKTVAVKDNVCVAGVPMMNGSALLEGYVPNFDATIITRMLDAGATIKGKAVCEQYCMSGSSHTSDPAPVHNPHRMGYSAGGSSSGSAALVAAGEVDMAIGGDQGGSIRMPSAFCGLVGMKATHGLVPYTGVMPIESTIDHTGPMTANVADNALLLEVLAGSDGLDPRQYAPKTAAYTEALGEGAAGLKIGVVKEGFALPNLEDDVREAVLAGAAAFRELGATVEDISVPAHDLARAAWVPVALEGAQSQMMQGNGMGLNWKGLYNVGLLDAHARWRARAEDLAPTMKMAMLLGQYGLDHYGARYYAKAQNIVRRAKAEFDAVFGEYDALLMPTVPIKAPPLPDADASITEIIERAFSMLGNTQTFDVTGHPAITVPCGSGDGLPIGLMLVGADYAEATLYRAAAAFEGR